MRIETNDEAEIVRVNPYKIWPMLMTFILLVAWLVRLEAKVESSDSEFVNYKTSREQEFRAISNKLDSISQSVGDVRESVAGLKGELRAGGK